MYTNTPAQQKDTHHHDTHHHVQHRQVTRINESCCTYVWVPSNTSMSHVTHINESCRTYQ